MFNCFITVIVEEVTMKEDLKRWLKEDMECDEVSALCVVHRCLCVCVRERGKLVCVVCGRVVGGWNLLQ